MDEPRARSKSDLAVAKMPSTCWRASKSKSPAEATAKYPTCTAVLEIGCKNRPNSGRPYITPAPSKAPPSNSGSISMPAPIKAALVTNLPAPVSSTPLLADGASEVPVPIGDVSSAGL
jgi:hypothetical protein